MIGQLSLARLNETIPLPLPDSKSLQEVIQWVSLGFSTRALIARGNPLRYFSVHSRMLGSLGAASTEETKVCGVSNIS